MTGIILLRLAVILAAAFIVLAAPVAFAGSICGIASWYGTESGNRTATGAYFDGRSMTAAMPSRAWLGRYVRVTYGRRSVRVLVNDLGPALRLHRVIDLSKAAATAVGLKGLGRVCVDAADRDERYDAAAKRIVLVGDWAPSHQIGHPTKLM